MHTPEQIEPTGHPKQAPRMQGELQRLRARGGGELHKPKNRLVTVYDRVREQYPRTSHANIMQALGDSWFLVGRIHLVVQEGVAIWFGIWGASMR